MTDEVIHTNKELQRQLAIAEANLRDATAAGRRLAKMAFQMENYALTGNVGGLTLDASEVFFLAQRVRRLCRWAGMQLDADLSDQHIVAVSGVLIGQVFTKLMLVENSTAAEEHF